MTDFWCYSNRDLLWGAYDKAGMERLTSRKNEIIRRIRLLGADPAARREALANSLSLTMPYSLWAGLAEDLDKSCLTTHAWKEIEKRL